MKFHISATLPAMKSDWQCCIVEYHHHVAIVLLLLLYAVRKCGGGTANGASAFCNLR